ncbi:MAG TPA: PaaI family thioesterase [Candidatus Binatia bacterium]|nr:PaaI family thioesterase [Candidatus Binatia bacterium]
MKPESQRSTNMLAEIRSKLARGDAPTPPIARLIGFRLLSAADGQSVFEMEADERHWNPMGTLHGGVLCDIADAAMGFAFATTLAEGESFTTIELKINYLRPVWKARLRATGRVVKRGRKIGLVDCDVTDEKGALVARASSTCMALSPDEARGR